MTAEEVQRQYQLVCAEYGDLQFRIDLARKTYIEPLEAQAEGYRKHRAELEEKLKIALGQKIETVPSIIVP